MFQNPSDASMVGQQYTPEQRNFMAMAYERYHLQGRGTGHAWINTIIQEFIQTFPNSLQIPTKMIILRQNRKQNQFYTVHNLNSKVSVQYVS